MDTANATPRQGSSTVTGGVSRSQSSVTAGTTMPTAAPMSFIKQQEQEMGQLRRRLQDLQERYEDARGSSTAAAYPRAAVTPAASTSGSFFQPPSPFPSRMFRSTMPPTGSFSAAPTPFGQAPTPTPLGGHAAYGSSVTLSSTSPSAGGSGVLQRMLHRAAAPTLAS